MKKVILVCLLFISAFTLQLIPHLSMPFHENGNPFEFNPSAYQSNSAFWESFVRKCQNSGIEQYKNEIDSYQCKDTTDCGDLKRVRLNMVKAVFLAKCQSAALKAMIAWQQCSQEYCESTMGVNCQIRCEGAILQQARRGFFKQGLPQLSDFTLLSRT